jgi:uridine phosphorylase
MPPNLSPLNFLFQATVGSPSRAETLATLLDERPKPFKLASERGFLTITGRYKSVPVSIVSIGMGGPNMDFFVREMRESVHGDMVIIRYKFNHMLFVLKVI